MTATAENLPTPPAPPGTEAEMRAAEQAEDADAKLRRGAELARRNREAAKAAGKPTTLQEAIQRDPRFAQLRAEIENAEKAPERVLRIMPDEGDGPPLISDVFRRGVVPARFWNPNGNPPFVATLENYEPKTPGQKSALNAARLWLSRAMAGESAMLAIVGPQGTGKSHLLYACANALLDAGTKVYSRPWYELADELRYGGAHPITGAEIEAADVRRVFLRPNWGAKIWLLDEVRPTAGTAFDDMELTKLACHAYDRRYPVFITSNMNPLSDIMGAPAASRFREIVIDGPDARRA